MFVCVSNFAMMIPVQITFTPPTGALATQNFAILRPNLQYSPICKFLVEPTHALLDIAQRRNTHHVKELELNAAVVVSANIHLPRKVSFRTYLAANGAYFFTMVLVRYFNM